MTRYRPGFLILFLLILSIPAWSQQPLPVQTQAPTQTDTAKIVRILKADKLIFDRRDSLTDKVILVGHVEMQQGNTLFYCDSAIKDNITNRIEAFGNIHINDADSVHTYSQYLRFDGNTRIARLLKKVKLTDGKAVLTTDELEYDLNAKIGTYVKGGKVVNRNSVLTSQEGYYYADTREVYFKDKVRLTDPEYTMATDTLLYNIDQELATFMAATTINDGKTNIRTRSGYYDLKNGNASFGNRPVIEDSTQQIIAEKINYDKKSGEGLAEGNVIYKDTTQGATILAGQARFNSNSKNVVATLNPLMILKQNNDSLYITGDTLLSIMVVDTLPAKGDSSMAAGKPGPGSKDSTQTAGMKPTPGQDSLQTTGINRPPATASKDSLQTVGIKRPLKQAGKDSTQTAGMKPTPGQDSLMTRKAKPLSDSMTAAASTLSRTDTLKGVTVMDTRQTDSIRLFHAFHHVRIFSDSLQGVCDSLSYSSRDSIFRFFKDPVLWAKDSQVSGDTIYLFTKNKKADQIFVFENGFSVNRTPESYFNQIKGNRLNGYFKDGNIDYMRAKGNAESVYYLQDDDSAYIGMNYARADAITMYFVDKDLKKVTWVNGVEGTTYPFKQIPDDKKELRNFKWQESRRPKTKYELFGQ